MQKPLTILALNPGSTSTKVALFENKATVFQENIDHSPELLAQFETIYDQRHFRKELIMDLLAEKNVDLKSLDAVVGRGGNMYPVHGGTYKVNELMKEHLKQGVMGQHASNLGGILADMVVKEIGTEIDSYIVDPVVVDEFEEVARISGSPDFERKSKDHPLNQKSVARKIAGKHGSTYEKLNFIVAHMGGGISVGSHKKGNMIDVNNCLDGDGPFSPERSGDVPVGALVDMCFSGEFTREEVRKKLTGQGGLYAYLGTTDGREVVKRIEAGDTYAELIYCAMAYQVAKEIGAAAAVLRGEVDYIVLTGGLAYDKLFTGMISEYVSFIAPIELVPGENEMIAMAQGVGRVLCNEEEERVYTGKKSQEVAK